VVEEQNSMKQFTFTLLVKLTGETFKILKTKHSLPSPFAVLLKSLIYMVFLDPHQGINDIAFFLPSSKS
jgi:hypothetical protein